jgi:hypothetical protein
MSDTSHRLAGQSLAEALIAEAQAPNAPAAAGLTRQIVDQLDALFVPSLPSNGFAAADGRGDWAYWRDHGQSTGLLMRHMAGRWRGDAELYELVGHVHDLDYLMHPHDSPKSRTGTAPMHPVPLALAMRKLGVHPAVILAVLEHAPYLHLPSAPSSRLSAALSAAEDLATLAALEPPCRNLEALSDEARELLSKVEVRHRIHREHRVRAETDLARYINQPLALFIDQDHSFLFDF